MLFDKFPVDFLYKKKVTNNNIVVIMTVLHILIYIGFYFLVFWNLANTMKGTLLFIAIMGTFLFNHVFNIKRYLKNKIE
jgi:hypothetical protein